MRLRLAPSLLLLLTTVLCHAQQSPWQGEWGAFTDSSATNGQRLTISDCAVNTCTLSLNVKASAGNCNTAQHATITVLSATDATANLPGETTAQSCKLQLHRAPAQPAITITATGDTCTSYYCTSPTVTFAHTYPQQSVTPYVGWFSDQCFANAPAARMATCTDPSLADLEKQWLFLYSDFPLTPVAKDASTFSTAGQIDATIITHCNNAPNPSTCLHDRFTTDLALMNAKKNSIVDGYTERGDPAEAARLAAKVSGRYRHSFANGDVQGDHFRSTDALNITPVGRASIHFDAHLEFYNGHTCDLSGGALYRKNGSFVYDDNSSKTDPTDPACHLIITPTSTGITFQDPDGGCKNISCGERGGWDGATFTFNERIPSKQPAK